MENLKAIETEGYIPVLVITAQPAHKLQALLAGAKDFVSKPFDLTEVKTRIHNMLEVRLLHRRLDNYNKVLEQTVQERTAELRESEARFRALTEWPPTGTGSRTKTSASPRCPARYSICSEFRWDRPERDQGAAGFRVERSGAHRTRSEYQSPAPVPRFPLQPRQARWLVPAFPGQRRTDLRPLRALHRLPRHRRGSDRTPVYERDLAFHAAWPGCRLPDCCIFHSTWARHETQWAGTSQLAGQM